MNKYHSVIAIVFTISFVGFYFNDTTESWKNQVSKLCQDYDGKHTLDEMNKCNIHNQEMFWYVILYQSGVVTALFSPLYIVIVMPHLKARLKQ